MKKPSIKTCRRALQIGVAVAFIVIPLLNHYRISYFTGNFLSFYAAGLPLADPLAVLQITLKNYYINVDLLIGGRDSPWACRGPRHCILLLGMSFRPAFRMEPEFKQTSFARSR